MIVDLWEVVEVHTEDTRDNCHGLQDNCDERNDGQQIVGLGCDGVEDQIRHVLGSGSHDIEILSEDLRVISHIGKICFGELGDHARGRCGVDRRNMGTVGMETTQRVENSCDRSDG